MEDFSALVEKGREDGVLRTFVPMYDLTPEDVNIAAGE